MSDPTDALPAQAEKKPGLLDGLPLELSRHRVLSTKATLEFLAISPAHWRRLRASGEAPQPIMLGARRQGWRLSTLLAWLETREQRGAAA